MNNIYCPAPWNALYYKDSLKSYKPCCEFKKWVRADSIDEYFNSDIINELKDSVIKGVWHEYCKVCKDKTDMGVPNYADMLIDKITNDGDVDISKFNLKWLDYRPGNLCNLKCRMCSVVNSNMIEKEAMENPIIMEVMPDGDRQAIGIGNKNSELLPELIAPELFENLMLLKVLGGEPTLDPQIFKLLEYIGTLPSVSNIVLNYTTNGTSINKRWINATKKFKSVNINFSIDGSYDTYNYIRTGGNYKDVVSNMSKLIEQTENFGSTRINIVWSNFNALTVDKWANDLVDVADSLHTKCNFTVIDLVYPPHLHTRFLPAQIKDKVYEKLELVKDKSLAKQFRYYMDKNVSSKEIMDNKKLFFNYVDALDKVRKTDINNLSNLYQIWREHNE